MKHESVNSAVVFRTFAIQVAAFVITWFGWLQASPEALAQCSVGSVIGACSQNAQNNAGCCNGQRVQWCENTSLCEINCAGNSAACCTGHGGLGCCDTVVTNCVCNIDAYCCGNDFWLGGEWDTECANIALTQCGCGSCSTQCGWDSANSIYDCAASASASPNAQFPRTCGGGGSCTPDCAGKTCGPDGCGGVCGSCLSTEQCSSAGTCQPLNSCTPNCTNKNCGPDGCGGVCGSCLSTEQCSSVGRCEPVGGCVPNCTDKNCGSDGCGGVCGSCLSSEECSAAGRCQPLNPNNPDAGGGDTGCVPDCAGKACGSDGCGGSCGACPAGKECNSLGQCGEPSCSCVGKECGDNGCGRICGYCNAGFVCNEATNTCEQGGAEPPADTSDGSDTSEPGSDVGAGGSDTTDTWGPGNCPQGFLWSEFQGRCVEDPNAPPPGGPVIEDKASGCYGAAGSPWAFGVLLAWALRRRTT